MYKYAKKMFESTIKTKTTIYIFLVLLFAYDCPFGTSRVVIRWYTRLQFVDTPSPEGSSKSPGDDDVERIILTAQH